MTMARIGEVPGMSQGLFVQSLFDPPLAHLRFFASGTFRKNRWKATETPPCGFPQAPSTAKLPDSDRNVNKKAK
jgi:hypothetical protein